MNAEDPMELSLDPERRAFGYEDIELDLDLTGDAVIDPNDDDMAEDDMPSLEQNVLEDVYTGNDEQMIDESSDNIEESFEHLDQNHSILDEDIDDVGSPINNIGRNESLIQDEQQGSEETDEHLVSTVKPTVQPIDDRYLHQKDHTDNTLNAEKYGDGHVSQIQGTVDPQVPAFPLEETYAAGLSNKKLSTTDNEDFSYEEKPLGAHDADESWTQSAKFSNTKLDTVSNDTTNDLVEFEASDAALSNNHSEEKEVHEKTEENLDKQILEDLSSISHQTSQPVPDGRLDYSEAVEGGFASVDEHISMVQQVGTPEGGEAKIKSEFNQFEVGHQGQWTLQSVFVLYQGDKISLFPPENDQQDESQTYFLQDEKFAWDSIHNLLDACKLVLGESIGDQEELEINIEELGLQIKQSCAEAKKITLAQILDIKSQLHYYDGNEVAPPLLITLTTQVNLSRRLQYLHEAVSQGKGLSELELGQLVEEDNVTEHSISSGAESELQEVEKGGTSSDLEASFQAKTQRKPSVTSLSADSSMNGSMKTSDAARPGPEKPLQSPKIVQKNPAKYNDLKYLTEGCVDLENAQVTADRATEADRSKKEKDTSDQEIYDKELTNDSNVEILNEESSPGSSTIQGDEVEVLMQHNEVAISYETDELTSEKKPLVVDKYNDIPVSEEIANLDHENEQKEQYFEHDIEGTRESGIDVSDARNTEVDSDLGQQAIQASQSTLDPSSIEQGQAMSESKILLSTGDSTRTSAASNDSFSARSITGLIDADGSKRFDRHRVFNDPSPNSERSNKISSDLAEPQSALDSKKNEFTEDISQHQDDFVAEEDEITYEDEDEDEEEDTTVLQTASSHSQSVSSSPGPSKRARSETDPSPIDNKSQDSKRIRSR